MDFKYQKIKKLDFKRWLLGGNVKIYTIILIVFLAAVIFVFSTVKSYTEQEPQDAVSTETAPTVSENSSSYVESNQLYQLRINKSRNFLTVYKMNEALQFTDVYKVMLCSVHPQVETGETSIADKYIWRRLSDNVYGHYTSRLENGVYIHSVPYSAQDISKLDVNAYNILGKPAQKGFVYLKAEDAKWIYENCGIHVTVVVYEEDNEQPAIALEDLETLSSSAKFDPSDENAAQNNVTTKIDYMTGVRDCTIRLNEPFDQWKGIYAVDMNGTDITAHITITGTVDVTKAGTYTLIYHLSDNFGTNLDYYRYVTVTETN